MKLLPPAPKLIACIHKELLLLRRDLAGLAVLFIMPVFLVIIMSLVQNNLLRIVGESRTEVLFADQDNSTASKAIAQRLPRAGNLILVRKVNGRDIPVSELKKRVSQGEYQAGLVIPSGMAQALSDKAASSLNRDPVGLQESQDPSPVHVDIYFDPAVRGTFRLVLKNGLRAALSELEAEYTMQALLNILPQRILQTTSVGPEQMPQLSGEISKLSQRVQSTSLVQLREAQASRQAFQKTPSAVQQNVPAWALFSIFFIVVPMAGNLIQEKNDGPLRRLCSMPVSQLTLILGKIIAYGFVCTIQLGLIFCVGKFLLPALGTSELIIGPHYTALALISFSAILAATGYGIFLGTLCSTFEQASIFGPISVVIAAAIGGIMVPVYAMPDFMQGLSILSPLNWGLEAYIQVIVRDGDLWQVLPQILALALFFVANGICAWLLFFKRIRAA
ncbi:MAG: ABC transporter permease [Desulfovermiculus sp.]